jgi:DNA-directed RNA polymerase subunit RPC12/RpoP
VATSPQRAYRAACPNCGAPVEFQSAASASAVCSFCRSTLVRDGDTLRRIGQSAELFDDHSPLQLGAAGRYQGAAFTLVGRLQYGYEGGTWNEWHALFDSGGGQQKSGWLSEDNGQYVFAFDAPLSAAPPAATDLPPGARRIVNSQVWEVASATQARLLAAQGELPAPPKLETQFTVADLRSTQGEVGTLDYSDAQQPTWSIGRRVALSELALTGLAEASEKTLKGRGIECPNCGAALEIKLTTTQSIVCTQCRSVVDVSQGVGGDLAHYQQANAHIDGGQPQIPLGTTGTLALGGPAQPWQVVGYAERAELPEDPEDEQTLWREYLLYHRQEGFAFIVDAEDGWSWSRPITGVPERVGDHVKLNGVQYKPLYTYTGIVTYVLGEFYWRLQRDERTLNTDYQGLGADARKRLNREMTGPEVVWSGGETLEAASVAHAFNLPDTSLAALQRDTSPLASGTQRAAWSLGKGMLILLLIVVVLIVLSRCGSGDDCSDTRATFGEASNEYRQCLDSRGSGGAFRTGGGSFGGFSSGGGGHK